MAYQPGAFTWDGTQGVVVYNLNFTLVTFSAPLEAGEFAFVYAEGIGPVSNQPPTGSAAPEAPLAMAQAGVQVNIAGMPTLVPFAGLAPDFAGLYQINFQVPPGLPSGSVSLVVNVAGVDAPVVQVWVR